MKNIRGEVFLKTLGFKPGATTTDIAVLVAVYFAFAGLAVGLFLLRLPRLRGGGVRGRLARLLGRKPA